MLEAQRRLYGVVCEFRATILIRPQGQGRPRFGQGHTYTPANTRRYIDALRKVFKERWGDRDALDVPLIVRVDAEFLLPKSAGKKGRAHHMQRPDVDNVAKAALDALMPEKKRGKIVWPGVISDDALVTELWARKQWSIVGDALHIQIWSKA